MKRLESKAGKLTYANVMATIAVFLALGGGAFAAVKLGKNAVGTKNIKNSAVTRKKIQNGSVDASKAKLGSLGIYRSGRRTLNPADASGVAGQQIVTLVNTGGLVIRGVCRDNGASKLAVLDASSASGTRVRVFRQGPLGDPVNQNVGLGSSFTDLTSANNGALETVRYDATFMVNNGPSISIDAIAGVNVQAQDCVFSANGVGV